MRHNLDMAAIAAFFASHLHLALTRACYWWSFGLFLLTPALLMLSSLAAFNYCTKAPQGACGFGHRDWSCLLWMALHMGVMGVTLVLYHVGRAERSCIV